MAQGSAVSDALAKYDKRALTVCSIGSHSALDVCLGGKKYGLRTLVVAAKGRERTYAVHYRTREVGGCVDETIVIDRFSDILDPGVQGDLLARNVIFVPNRSFEVYLRQRYSYDEIERGMLVPFFGSRTLLRAEERGEDAAADQYSLLDRAGIRYPRRLSGPSEIDGLTIVKAPHAKVSFERAFFLTTDPLHYRERSAELVERGIVTLEGLATAVFEEYVVGPTVNLNFFWSPVHDELELLGTDTRRQTDIDGARALLAREQAAIGDGYVPGMEEAGHIATTLTESMLEQAFDMGSRFVDAARAAMPPGIIGPFALQCVIAAGPPKTFVVYDVSLRIPGSPGTKYTPYSAYRWGVEMSVGERIAKEIVAAREANRLADICT
jgi:5-formaminoimidazole-4-carboxamide-1-(beta)-D-ribofuranosyl 5'-monophosphate synthetase